MINKLNNFWKQFIGVSDPIAHNLKHDYQDRWVRFHALPESKRYPENECEYQVIFSRHNAVLKDLGNLPLLLFVILPEYSESRQPNAPDIELVKLFPKTQHWRTIEAYEDCDDLYLHLHVAQVQFNGCELNDLFRLVADDETGNILIVSTNNPLIFHPYDGGADVILTNSNERDSLKQKYANWLSEHPDGF